MSHHLLSDLIVFWLQNEHYPPQAREDVSNSKSFWCLNRFAKDNHHLAWHFAPPTRAAESIGFSSNSGVGIFMSTPTPAPTPTCLEWMTLCCSHVEHSYARHLIAGQKLQAGGSSVAYMFVCFSGIKRIIDTYDQMQWVPACVYSWPDLDPTGSGDGSLHSITEPFLRSRLINVQHYLNARYITAVPLIWGVLNSFVIYQKWLQKKLLPGPDQVPHFRHRGRDVSRSGISTDAMSAMAYAEQRSSVPIIQPVHHINLGRKML